MPMKFLRQQKGFSLIELLMVVTILGILVGVTYPAWNRAVSVRNMEKRNANLRTLNMTGDRLTLADTTGTVNRVTNPATGIVTEVWVPGWLDQFPDQVGDSPVQQASRAVEVTEYFLDNGWLPGHLRGVIAVEGIGFKYGQFFAIDP
jgi:prepilin-type N-terminal cleavage/methylation domain-containing protein